MMKKKSIQTVQTIKLNIFKVNFNKIFNQQLQKNIDIADKILAPDIKNSMLDSAAKAVEKGVVSLEPVINEAAGILSSSVAHGSVPVTQAATSAIIGIITVIPKHIYQKARETYDSYIEKKLIEESANINEYVFELGDKLTEAIIAETGHEIARVFEYQISMLKKNDVIMLARFAVSKLINHLKDNPTEEFSRNDLLKILVIPKNIYFEVSTLETKTNISWKIHKIFTAVGLRKEMVGGGFSYHNKAGTNPSKYGYRAKLLSWSEERKIFIFSELDKDFDQIPPEAHIENAKNYIPLNRLVTQNELDHFLSTKTEERVSFSQFFNRDNFANQGKKIAVFRDIALPKGISKQEKYNLHNFDFSNVDMLRIALTNVNLQGSVFDNSDMFLAEITSCNMENAQLKKTDLKWSNLRGVKLRGSTDLTGTKFDYAFIDEETDLRSNPSFKYASKEGIELLTDKVDDEVLAEFYMEQRWREEENKDEEKRAEEKQKYKAALVKIEVNIDSFEHVTTKFYGRIQYLDNIHTYFTTHDRSITKDKVFIIGELPGMGKTQVALAYINNYKDEYSNRVIWIAAENKVSLDIAFRQLAESLGLIPDRMSPREILLWVKRKLANHLERALIIFDNVEDSKLVRKYLPKRWCKNNHDVIITTNKRLEEWEEVTRSKGYNVKKLTGLGLKYSIEMISKVIVDDNAEDIEKLAKLFGCIPLGISQSLDYIVNSPNKITISEYISKHQELIGFGRLPEELLSSIDERDSNYEHIENVYFSLLMSLYSLKKHSLQAFEIIELCSFLNADNIPAYLFDSLFGSQEQQTSIIGILKGSSLISIREEGAKIDSISIHRFIQEVVRISNIGNQVSILTKAMELVHNQMYDGANVWDDLEVLKNNKPLHKQALSLIEHYVKIYRINLNNDFLKSIAVKLYINCGNLYYTVGQYNEAQQQYELALSSAKDSEIAIITYYIGHIYYVLGKNEDALSRFEQTKEIYKAEFGYKHHKFARVMHAIADIYQDKGELDKALEIYKDTLKVFINNHGLENHSVVTTMHEIGNIYRLKKEFDKALTQYNDTLALKKKVYSENHPQIAVTINRIGDVYYAQKRYSDAIKQYIEALEIRSGIYGKRHPQVAMTKLSIGDLHFVQHENKEAGEYYKQVLNIQKEFFGENNNNFKLTLTYLRNTETAIRLEPYILIAFTIREIIETGPLIEYVAMRLTEVTTKTLDMQNLKDTIPQIIQNITLSEFLNHNYFWIGMHAACNAFAAGGLSVTHNSLYSNKLLLPVISTFGYATKLITYEYISNLNKANFMLTQGEERGNYDINTPYEFIKKCGPYIANQLYISLVNDLGIIVLEPFLASSILYNVATSSSIGIMQCSIAYKQEVQLRPESKSILIEAVPLVADALVFWFLWKNMKCDFGSIYKSMESIKQVSTILSLVVMTDYTVKLIPPSFYFSIDPVVNYLSQIEKDAGIYLYNKRINKTSARTQIEESVCPIEDEPQQVSDNLDNNFNDKNFIDLLMDILNNPNYLWI